MSENRRSEKRGERGAVLAIGLAVLLLKLPECYVLSEGPALYLMGDERIQVGTYLATYRPLDRLSRRCSLLDRVRDEYRLLWLSETELAILKEPPQCGW